LVSCGAASAAAHAHAACLTGADPEKISQLPDLTGLKTEVIMPRSSRTPYDFAVRSLGLKIINVETREELFSALSDRTSMLQMLSGERSQIKLEDMVEAGRKAGVPVFVDAAAEWPEVPNPYLKRGADLVCYSGGKILRGPQCAGLLLGRKDLIQAAWISSAPHHGFGRMMKVGKEEIMGMLAAVETFVQERKYETEVRQWQEWLSYIGDKLAKIPGVETKVGSTAPPNPHPPLQVRWDPETIGMTAGELHDILLEGEPRIMTLAEGDGHSCVLRAAGMIPGDEKLVAEQLVDVFQAALKRGKSLVRPPAADISGQWDVEVRYAAVSSRHRFILKTTGNEVSGEHAGRKFKSELRGVVDGDRVRLRSQWEVPGFHVSHRFEGKFADGRMSGDVHMGEYGHAAWTATRRA
jgi:D-glucosaminate-6-phosphate ammonia-lyase